MTKEEFFACFDTAVSKVLPMVNGEIDESEFVSSLLALKEALMATDSAELAKLELDPNVAITVSADKSMVGTVFTKDVDCASLLSTLVTYEASRREGCQKHSMVYMKRVTKLRGYIDHYFNEEAEKFCGSDVCGSDH